MPKFKTQAVFKQYREAVFEAKDLDHAKEIAQELSEDEFSDIDGGQDWETFWFTDTEEVEDDYQTDTAEITGPLTIIVEGGLVQGVVTHDQSQIGQTVTIVDYDTEGADESELSIVKQEGGKDVEAFVRQDEVLASAIETEFDNRKGKS